MSSEAIRTLITEELVATDVEINNQLNSSIPLINELGQHIINSGGKRLRPMLVLLGAKLFNYIGHAHIQLAAVIELIHTATLLHDDVVDVSQLRRGKQTANAVWDNAASVLVGDFLYSRSFQMMVSVGKMAVMDILAQATNTIAEGEVLQLQNRNNPHTTQQRYMDVVRYKTGTLFKTAAQLGAVLCDQPSQQIEVIGNYGLHLGTAFQLIDDALDYCASSAELGKNIGDDLAEGKPTLPLIHILNQGTAEQKRLVENAIVTGDRENLPQILQAIESTNAIDYTYAIAQQESAQALQALESLPASIYRDALASLAHFAVERHY